VHFNDGPVAENPREGKPVRVRFILNGECQYETIIGPGEWARADIKYAADWCIEVRTARGRLIHRHHFDPAHKSIRINIDSRSLGDTLAWMPHIDRYKRKNPSVELFVSQFWDSLDFQAQYPDIKFIAPDLPLDHCYATYNLGYYFDRLDTRHPVDPRTVPLGKVASDILGIEYQECRPRMAAHGPGQTIPGRYVCVATASTANLKHWLHDHGWQSVVDSLRARGFGVVVVQKEPTALKNVIDRTGDIPIPERISDLRHCEFFVGLGSGLSWLAWALGKPVVMISGFSKPFAEFMDKCYRVVNDRVCNGCWNDTAHVFDRGDWNWCPKFRDTNRQFECSRSITPQMVMQQIDRLIADLQPNVS